MLYYIPRVAPCEKDEKGTSQANLQLLFPLLQAMTDHLQFQKQKTWKHSISKSKLKKFKDQQTEVIVDNQPPRQMKTCHLCVMDSYHWINLRKGKGIMP